ncbi:MAG: PEGA domain-containing protein, partial [Methanomicrobiales archaeon]|nr:PEGA domain-containing protein [Methanomicrobiales archaeon]
DPVPSGAWDASLVRIDSHGRLLWERTIGGTGNEYGTAVVMTGDDGFFLAGRTGSRGPSADVSLVKGSSLGNPLWDLAFGGARYDAASALRETSDGGLVIAGTTDSFGRGDDVYLIRLVPPSGTLVVTSTPAGATLSLDGVSRGETPLTLANVSAGLHTIQLRHPGYEEYRGEIRVVSGASPTLVDAILVAIPETPTFTVTPSPTPDSQVGDLIPVRQTDAAAAGETGSFFSFRLPDFSHLFSLF